MATLEIRIDPRQALDGLEVRRDGALLARAAWNDKLPIDPGPHEVSVSRPGRAPWQTTVEVPGTAQSIVVQVPPLDPVAPPIPVPPATASPAPAAPAPDASASAPDPRTRRIAGYAIAGAGIAAVGVGAYLGFSALAKNHDATALCPTPGACTSPTGVSLSDQARGLGDASTVTLLAGAAVAAAGVVLVVLSPSRADAPRVGVAVGPRQISLEGAF
jgi:hypothetical protein